MHTQGVNTDIVYERNKKDFSGRLVFIYIDLVQSDDIVTDSLEAYVHLKDGRGTYILEYW